MFIYKVERTDTDQIDSGDYDGFVVVAKNEDDARKFHPDGGSTGRTYSHPGLNNWTENESIEVTRIGTAKSDIPEGVVMASQIYG